MVPEIIGLFHHGGLQHSGGGLEGNPLKRCLKGVIRCEWLISTLRGGVGFVLVSQGCVTAQTFVEIEEKFFLFFPPPPIPSQSFVAREWWRTRTGDD